MASIRVLLLYGFYQGIGFYKGSIRYLSVCSGLWFRVEG